jgi:D-arabinose 1-dehydrogenase-like Zn-dependent alcohol dehydrogenase
MNGISVKERKAFGTGAADLPLDALTIKRRNPTPHDVEIEILYCGVCHSDLHTARKSGTARCTLVYPAMRLWDELQQLANM